MNKTLHYVISLHFSDEKQNIEILENNSLKKTKKRVIIFIIYSLIYFTSIPHNFNMKVLCNLLKNIVYSNT